MVLIPPVKVKDLASTAVSSNNLAKLNVEPVISAPASIVISPVNKAPSSTFKIESFFANRLLTRAKSAAANVPCASTVVSFAKAPDAKFNTPPASILALLTTPALALNV